MSEHFYPVQVQQHPIIPIKVTKEATPISFLCIILLRSPGALTFGYGCAVHVGVDAGAGDAEVDIIYITFIMSAQYTGYLVLYKARYNWTT